MFTLSPHPREKGLPRACRRAKHPAAPISAPQQPAPYTIRSQANSTSAARKPPSALYPPHAATNYAPNFSNLKSRSPHTAPLQGKRAPTTLRIWCGPAAAGEPRDSRRSTLGLLRVARHSPTSNVVRHSFKLNVFPCYPPARSLVGAPPSDFLKVVRHRLQIKCAAAKL